MIDYLVREFNADRDRLVEVLSADGTFWEKIGEDIALFERKREGVVEGHYAFKSKGRRGIDRAREILKRVFDRDVSVIVGVTPDENKAAKWFSRQLGFKQISTVETPEGPAVVFMLQKGDK